MNTNNRNNNNRRRGRGNRQQGGGGGQQLNRIDSRARGNAPQLLEKYRKLAQDAHLNGDRVQAEYYLQFADHYFRVLADQRQRQEEQRAQRDGRWEGGNEGYREEGEDQGDFAGDGDFPSFDQPGYQRRERQQHDDRPREERPRREERFERGEEDEAAAPAEAASDNPYEPAENPFVRPERGTRGLRPRREGPRQRRDAGEDDGGSAGLDPASLPPAISASREEPEADAEAGAKPKRGRPRKTRPADDGAGEPLESVN